MRGRHGPQVAPLDFGHTPAVPEQELRGWEASEVGPLGRAWRAITSNVSDMPGSVRLVAPLETLQILIFMDVCVYMDCIWVARE